MKLSEIEFDGEAFLRENIDFSAQPEDQIWSLNQDIGYIKYENKLLIDIGWHPEFDPKGKFVVYILKNGIWTKNVKTLNIEFDEFPTVIKKLINKYKKKTH